GAREAGTRRGRNIGPVAASEPLLASARDAGFEGPAVAVGSAAAGDRRLSARAVRGVAGARVARVGGTDDGRRLAVARRGVARRDRTRVGGDTDLLLCLTGMAREVAGRHRAEARSGAVGIFVAAPGNRRTDTLPARRAGVGAGADLLVVARRARVGDVLTSGRGIAGVAGADIAVVAVDRPRRAIAPTGRRVRDPGIIRTQVAVVAELGAEVETRAGEITVGEVRGQGGGTDGDRLVVVRVAGWSVA